MKCYQIFGNADIKTVALKQMVLLEVIKNKIEVEIKVNNSIDAFIELNIKKIPAIMIDEVIIYP